MFSLSLFLQKDFTEVGVSKANICLLLSCARYFEEEGGAEK